MTTQPQEPSPYFEVPPAAGTSNTGSTISGGGIANPDKTPNTALIEQELVSQATSAQMPQQLAKQGSVQDDSNSQLGQPAQQLADDNSAFPQIADDDDLIEKEWVVTAKEIVARTAHDPHLQNREISKMKADYMKKRYNKNIKLVEDD